LHATFDPDTSGGRKPAKHYHYQGALLGVFHSRPRNIAFSHICSRPLSAAAGAPEMMLLFLRVALTRPPQLTLLQLFNLYENIHRNFNAAELFPP